MDFKNLESKETVDEALVWAAGYIQQAMQNKQKSVKFTFSANEENSLDSIFDFTIRLSKELEKFSFIAWCVLNNKENSVLMKVMI